MSRLGLRKAGSLGVLLHLFLCDGTAATSPRIPSPPRVWQEKSVQDPASLQRKAFAKFKELQNTMRQLKEEMAEREPDKAKRIQAGLRYMAEAGIEKRMAEVASLLEDKAWDEAIRTMDGVRRNLDELLQLLLDRDVDLRELMERIEKLEKFKDEVENLLAEQRAEKEASVKAEAIRKHLADIAKAKKKIDDLVAKQKDLLERTRNQPRKGPGNRDLAERQSDLGRRAEDLEAELTEIESEARELSEEEGSGKPGAAGEGTGAAGAAMGKAAESMDNAGTKLGANAPEAALDDQEDALDEMKKAREALEEMAEVARRRLREIPFEQFERAQLETMKKTDDLAEEMEKAETSEGGEGSEGEPIPGRKNLEQAVPKQRNAAGSLKKREPGKAKNDQKDAEDDLDEAKKKLEDALAQLRQELQEEVLKALEERFSAMLARQKELTLRTALTEKRRGRAEALAKKGIVPSSVKAACAKIAEGEFMLRDEAKDALALLKEEGSTAVFPEIVGELAGELGQVGRLVEGYETGKAVQEYQKEIERMLADLLDALTRTIEYKENENQNSNCDDQDQSLVPLSAELRMLRTLQKSVNKKTKILDRMKKGSKVRKNLADRAAKQEGKVENLTRKLADKLQKEEGDGDGGDGK